MNDDKKRISKIISILKKEYPDVKIALSYSNPFQLLIATILSAQCTDERVNLVTEKLFKKYKTPNDFINGSIEALEKDIFSTGFYKQKAKSIKECCESLAKNFSGKVPDDFEKLVSLPGVGRKTASVVVGNAFGIPAIAVDTHVKRLSNLLGFAESDSATDIELSLKKIITENDWTISSHLFAEHGRKICNARKPKCNECLISDYCPSKKLN